jgi:hypothetical protein
MKMRLRVSMASNSFSTGGSSVCKARMRYQARSVKLRSNPPMRPMFVVNRAPQISS